MFPQLIRRISSFCFPSRAHKAVKTVRSEGRRLPQCSRPTSDLYLSIYNVRFRDGEWPATVRAYAMAREINTQPTVTEEAKKVLFGQTAVGIV
jgi:hypothetical protein